jgi:PAS domain-containing protein
MSGRVLDFGYLRLDLIWDFDIRVQYFFLLSAIFFRCSTFFFCYTNHIQPYKKDLMKRVCSWCKKDLETGEVYFRYDDSMTHGICKDCIDNMEFQLGVDLQRFIDSIKEPLVVIDADIMVTTANKEARRILGKELPDISNKRPGEVFECAYARYPEGCGRTVHCSGCAIRRTVEETFKTGKFHKDVPATIKYDETPNPEMIVMNISTEKMKDVVFLRIEQVKKKQRGLN